VRWQSRVGVAFKIGVSASAGMSKDYSTPSIQSCAIKLYSEKMKATKNLDVFIIVARHAAIS
jgi:hypothetical protein